MKGKSLLALCLLLLLSCLSYARFGQIELKASGILPVHDLNTGLNYSTIQDAINANETLNGDKIEVDSGIYYESINVNKSLTLVGQNEDTTILDGNGTGPAFTITAQNVSLVNFTATNAGVPREYTGYPDSPSPAEAILLNGTSFCSVENVETSRNNFGIYLNYSNLNTILNCISIGTQSIVNGDINASQAGIVLGLSNENTIADSVSSGSLAGIAIIGDGNLLTGNQAFSNIGHGFDIVGPNNIINSCKAWNNSDGILLDYADGTIVKENAFVNNTHGVWLIDGSSNNTLYENTIQNDTIGISGSSSMDFTNCGNNNLFYHNNIIGNTLQVFMPPQLSNEWDSGYPSGGNYWSDNNSTDFFNGIYQNVSGKDGIGDSAYIEDAWNVTDNYPLMGMFSDFNATPQYDVQTVCNSTLSDFQFNGTAINFNASGENGTTGFCRICIPKGLINGTFTVFVNGTEIPYALLPESNSTNSYLYFTYHHSTQEVIIAPEFPSFLILSLFLAVTLLTAIMCKKRQTRIA